MSLDGLPPLFTPADIRPGDIQLTSHAGDITLKIAKQEDSWVQVDDCAAQS